MATYRVNKFDGAAISTTGFSTRKAFTPDMDLRTVGYWDATRADLQTEVISTNSVPKLTALKGVVGPTLTSFSAGRAPAARTSGGSRGLVWRSDSGNEGVQSLLFPTGMLPAATRAIIGIVMSQSAASSSGRLLNMSADGLDAGQTLLVQWSQFGAPNNYSLVASTGLGATSLTIPNYPLDGSLHCVLYHFLADGSVAARLDGTQIATVTAATAAPLLPNGGTGSIGGGFAGSNNGISGTSGTRITHVAIATTGNVPAESLGVAADADRDRNAAAYWEASLMYEAGISSLLPPGHPFKAERPVTTWLGERT